MVMVCVLDSNRKLEISGVQEQCDVFGVNGC